MNEAISQLNRNTALKTSGQTPDSKAMNQFGNIIFKYLDKINFDNSKKIVIFVVESSLILLFYIWRVSDLD